MKGIWYLIWARKCKQRQCIEWIVWIWSYYCDMPWLHCTTAQAALNITPVGGLGFTSFPSTPSLSKHGTSSSRKQSSSLSPWRHSCNFSSVTEYGASGVSAAADWNVPKQMKPSLSCRNAWLLCSVDNGECMKCLSVMLGHCNHNNSAVVRCCDRLMTRDGRGGGGCQYVINHTAYIQYLATATAALSTFTWILEFFWNLC